MMNFAMFLIIATPIVFAVLAIVYGYLLRSAKTEEYARKQRFLRNLFISLLVAFAFFFCVIMILMGGIYEVLRGSSSLFLISLVFCPFIFLIKGFEYNTAKKNQELEALKKEFYTSSTTCFILSGVFCSMLIFVIFLKCIGVITWHDLAKIFNFF